MGPEIEKRKRTKGPVPAKKELSPEAAAFAAGNLYAPVSKVLAGIADSDVKLACSGCGDNWVCVISHNRAEEIVKKVSDLIDVYDAAEERAIAVSSLLGHMRKWTLVAASSVLLSLFFLLMGAQWK